VPNSPDVLNTKLSEIPETLADLLYFLKPILTFEEACKYTGLSKSTMYKKTADNGVPFYKPEKNIYFKREDLDNWMLRNRHDSNEEISRKATKHSLSA
jgi:excisionase family DNA binding protein